MKRWLAIVYLLSLAITGMAQDNEPEVLFVNPGADAIVREVVGIVVEGKNFPDLMSFGFADFLYSDDGGASFNMIGRDQNTFDGLSFSWDTLDLPDGEYHLRVEVTDLTNTMGVGAQRVFVNNQGNDSLSNRTLTIMADLLGALSRALNSPEDLELTQAVGLIQDNLGAASVTVRVALEDAIAIRDELPTLVRNQDPLLEHMPLFVDIMQTYLDAESSIEALLLDEAQEAFVTLGGLMQTLSTLTVGDVDFSPLQPVADALNEASGKLDQLIAAIQGETEASSDEVLGEFVSLTRLAVPILESVELTLRTAEAACPVAFSDSQSVVSVHYAQAETQRSIQVGDGSAAGSLRLFNDQGEPVLETAFAQPFQWDGTDSNGNALADGVYYFSIALEEGAEQVKTGRLRVVP